MKSKKGKRLVVSMLLLTFLGGLVEPDTGVIKVVSAEDSTTVFLSKFGDVELDTTDGKEFQTVFTDYITVDETQLMEGENEFKFVSLNYPQATSDNPWEQANALKTIMAMGGKVTRTYTIPVTNGNNDGKAYVTGVDSEGNITFNENALNKLDSLLALANKYGVRVIIPLVDHWHWVGGIDGYVKLAGIPINTTSSLDPNAWQFYTNAKARNYFKQMISHLMERTNSVSGIKYKDDPAVICWETGNELAAYDDTANPKFPQEWTTDIAAHLKSTGIHQLVLDGKMDATAESLKDPNVDILGSHYYTGYYPDKTRKDTILSHNTGNTQALDHEGNPLPGKPFILGEFGAYTKVEDVNKVFDAGLEVGTNGMMMWSLRAHKDGYGYYFHSEDPGNWAAYHWPGFPSGDYYDETKIVRSIYAYASLLNGEAATIEEARMLPIPAPETEEPPLLYGITTVGDIKWRGVVGGAWYEIQRADGTSPEEGDWVTIADEADYVYDSGRNWENKEIPCIAGYHDETAITGQTYSYRLRACNESGTGLWSNIESVEAANHIVVDDLDMIAVSSSDQNPSEIRNVYSYDHSKNVTVSGGVLQNTSETEGYITYNATIPMTSIEIKTKNTPEVAPKVMVSGN
ncbi:MAG: cellulase family glycosylhydrolase, partial [Mobilitalea sp.]